MAIVVGKEIKYPEAMRGTTLLAEASKPPSPGRNKIHVQRAYECLRRMLRSLTPFKARLYPCRRLRRFPIVETYDNQTSTANNSIIIHLHRINRLIKY